MNTAKTKNIMRFLALFILSTILLCNVQLYAGDDAKVMEAYELRINGKADKAEELLNELLKNDSTNALAYFELARTKHHLFLGSGQFAPEKWEDVVHLLQKAVKIAPDNEIFAFYYAYSRFFNAFISLMMEKPSAGEDITHACDAFNAVLDLNPGCLAAQLYLVDIYSSLPENVGGNKENAKVIAEDMGKKDKVMGAIAAYRLLPETDDRVTYWQNVAKEAGSDARVLEELGRAYLFSADEENGTRYFLEAIKADNSRRNLYMNLTRYHMMASMQNPDNQAKHLEEAERLVNEYLSSDPPLVPALKAYCYGALASVKMFGKDEEGQKKYQELASSTDPFHSKASGMAPDILYCRPDEVKIRYSSFFMPF